MLPNKLKERIENGVEFKENIYAGDGWYKNINAYEIKYATKIATELYKDLERAVELLEAVDHLVSDEGKTQLMWRETLTDLKAKYQDREGE